MKKVRKSKNGRSRSELRKRKCRVVGRRRLRVMGRDGEWRERRSRRDGELSESGAVATFAMVEGMRKRFRKIYGRDPGEYTKQERARIKNRNNYMPEDEKSAFKEFVEELKESVRGAKED